MSFCNSADIFETLTTATLEILNWNFTNKNRRILLYGIVLTSPVNML